MIKNVFLTAGILCIVTGLFHSSQAAPAFSVDMVASSTDIQAQLYGGTSGKLCTLAIRGIDLQPAFTTFQFYIQYDSTKFTYTKGIDDYSPIGGELNIIKKNNPDNQFILFKQVKKGNIEVSGQILDLDPSKAVSGNGLLALIVFESKLMKDSSGSFTLANAIIIDYDENPATITSLNSGTCFEYTPYTVTVYAGANGDVSPKGDIVVHGGDFLDVTAAPSSPGYHFVDWTVTGGVTVVNAGSSGRFAVAGAGTITANFAFTKLDQTITFSSPISKTYGDADFDPGATALSTLQVTYSSSDNAIATIVSNKVHIVGAGNCTIHADQAGDATWNSAPRVSQPLTVNKAAATVTLSGLTHTYNGNTKAASATTDPVGLPVTITYDPSNPVNAGSYAVTATVNDANYTGSTTGTLVINKSDQTINFTALPPKMYGNSPFDLTGSASSGLTVSYSSSVTSVATVSGLTVTITGVGSTTITASQGGNGNYNPASPKDQTLNVTKGAATVTLASLSQTYDGTAKAATVTTDPAGLSVTFTYDPSNPVNAGNYAVTATVNDANYAGSATGTLVIGKAAATVTLDNLTHTYDGTTKAATATTTPAGLSVAITYNPANPVNGGNYTVTATVNEANYAGSNAGTLVINKANQTISFDALPVKTYGDSAFDLTATASSGLTVTYISSNTSVARITGARLSIRAAGSATITATQAGNTNYNAAAQVNQVLTVNKANQTITFNPLPAKKVGDADFSPGATVTSGQTISYTSSDTTVATITTTTPRRIHIKAAGTSTITASQTGNSNYNAATPVSQVLTVDPVDIAVTPVTPRNQANLIAAPNPARAGSDEVSLVILSKNPVYKVRLYIYDCLGNAVYSNTREAVYPDRANRILLAWWNLKNKSGNAAEAGASYRAVVRYADSQGIVRSAAVQIGVKKY